MAKQRTAAGQVRRWVEGILSQAAPKLAEPVLALLTGSGGAGTELHSGRYPASAPLATLLHEPLAELGSAAPDLDALVLAHAILGRLTDHLRQRTQPTRAELDHLVELCLRAVDSSARSAFPGKAALMKAADQFHIGVVVPDLEAALAELTALFGRVVRGDPGRSAGPATDGTPPSSSSSATRGARRGWRSSSSSPAPCGCRPVVQRARAFITSAIGPTTSPPTAPRSSRRVTATRRPARALTAPRSGRTTAARPVRASNW